ncbi:polysaccharide deacetylase family protein [Pelagibacterium lentulum]|uniref:polysaccharide deacetylase family protein n=1 Tax=Pelagibacterium lentulum TaxID=2029865 RepID=UPI001FCEA9C9|nr:polysaccharide deacetylase family protein [Pelagibacterium lentulum]
MLRFSLVLIALGVTLCGCAKPPQLQPQLAAYVGHDTDMVMTGSISADLSSEDIAMQPMPTPVGRGVLAGRTITVADGSQISLLPGEVVLTFDDGPRPGKTEAILDTLEAFNVNATFLMLGSAAQRHPELARAVARRGHAIGSHTYDHADLTTLSQTEAIAEIQAGHMAVSDALAAGGYEASRFFRFPYLSENGLLRASVVEGDLIVLGVDIDSKDYFRSTPQEVMDRTLARLEARGKGVVLFHDIHDRTVTMLPRFLAELEERGYSVVSLRTTGGGVFSRDLITAALPEGKAD